jgi:hypothetical protein
MTAWRAAAWTVDAAGLIRPVVEPLPDDDVYEEAYAEA